MNLLWENPRIMPNKWNQKDYDNLNDRARALLGKILLDNPGKYPHFVDRVDERCADRTFFRGFGCVDPKARYDHDDLSYLDDGAVGTFIDYRNGVNGPFFYSCIPNRKAAQYSRGDSFDIGTERIFPDIMDEKLEELLKAGLDNLYAVSMDPRVESPSLVI